MPWVGEDRHDQRLDQGEPMLSLGLVSLAGSREGTVQLAQEPDDGLFVHHGGCPLTVIIGPLDLTSAATFCSLATLSVDRSPPIGELGPGGRDGHGEDGPWPRPG